MVTKTSNFKHLIDNVRLKCKIMYPFKISAEAGIQKNIYWMPHQVRHNMPTKSKEALDALP